MKRNNFLPVTITRQWLEEQGACTWKVDLFEKIWPNGVVVTYEALVSAAKAGLSLSWLAERVLSRSAYSELEVKTEVLQAEYEAKITPVFADHEAKRDLLHTVYWTTRNSLGEDRKAECDTLEAGYESMVATLRDEYSAASESIVLESIAKRDTLRATILWAAYKENIRHAPPD